MVLPQLNGVMKMNNILAELKQELKNEKIIVATSGGPDSMALLHMLIKIKEDNNLTIICAHVNHHLREESNEEASMVKNYCQINNITFEYMEITNYEKGNTENMARTKRYNFFENLINKYQAKYLLTAHHGDDLTETILMRIVRGSSLKGYAGFPKKIKKNNYYIYRPLISVTKDNLLEYVNNNSIPYAIDKTNNDDNYTRNRYRKYILPVLKKENPNVHLKFLEFSETLHQYNEYINEITKEKLKKIYIDNTLNIENFKQEKQIIQTKIIYTILEDIYKDKLSLINSTHVKNIINLIYSNKPNLKINLPNKIIVQKNYNNLIISNNIQNKPYKYKLKDKLELPNGKTLEIIESSNDTSNYICYLNSKEINLPLWVRTRRDGDKMDVKGLNGAKKIKDIFIDEKINIKKRNTWPVVTDNIGQIIWLPGLKKSKFDKTKGENYDIIIRYH